jgi:hypothetical protein
MTQYISKSAIVAEIERKIKEINLDIIEDWRNRIQREHDIEVMKNILSLIDTIEVKEVREETVNEDLEEAAEEYAPDFSNSIASKAAVDAIRDAFKAGAQWQALHSLETIKGMEEQAFLSGVEAEQINKSFSKEELLNRWRNKL